MNLKKIFALLLVATMLFATGCDLFVSDKDFTKDGLTITLTNRFEEDPEQAATLDCNACYTSSSMAVVTIEVPFAMLGVSAGEISLDEYCELFREGLVTEGTLKDVSELTHENGLTYLTCISTEDPEVDTMCFMVFYETDDAFWVVELDCNESTYEKLKDTMIKYAKSVRFE